MACCAPPFWTRRHPGGQALALRGPGSAGRRPPLDASPVTYLYRYTVHVVILYILYILYIIHMFLYMIILLVHSLSV